jgi:Zn-finger nucleic acid-binding protein
MPAAGPAREEGPQRGLACTHCGEAMASLHLEGHYGNSVEIDLCARCHLVWFDAYESVRLSGLGWLALLRRMDQAMQHVPGPLEAHFPCPRCRVSMKGIFNATKFGRFTALECPRCRGQFRSFAQLLAERGLVRALHPRDVAVLAEEGRAPSCLNCGAPVREMVAPAGAQAGAPAAPATTSAWAARPLAAQGLPALGATATDTCAHCASPLLLLDLPRLMASLMVRDGLPLPDEGAEPLGWPCPACGAPVDPSREPRCGACGHAVLAPSLARLRPLFSTLEQRLRTHGAPKAEPQGARWKRRDGWRGTAFYRYVQRFLDPEQLLRARPLEKIVMGVLAALLLAWWLRG